MRSTDNRSRIVLAATAALFMLAMNTKISAQSSSPPTGQYSKRQWPSHAYPKQPIEVRVCSCLYSGKSIPIGETICMKFEGRQVLATCDTVVNSPSWSISSTPCPPV